MYATRTRNDDDDNDEDETRRGAARTRGPSHPVYDRMADGCLVGWLPAGWPAGRSVGRVGRALPSDGLQDASYRFERTTKHSNIARTSTILNNLMANGRWKLRRAFRTARQHVLARWRMFSIIHLSSWLCGFAGIMKMFDTRMLCERILVLRHIMETIRRVLSPSLALPTAARLHVPSRAVRAAACVLLASSPPACPVLRLFHGGRLTGACYSLGRRSLNERHFFFLFSSDQPATVAAAAVAGDTAAPRYRIVSLRGTVWTRARRLEEKDRRAKRNGDVARAMEIDRGGIERTG